MTVYIREAELSDVAKIYQIEQLAHLSPWSEKLISCSFSERNHNFVAVLNDEVVGYVFTSFVAGELTLENICVAKEQQGKGIGRDLMEALFSLARQLVAEEIWLEVRSSNSTAIQLYLSQGFIQQGIRKNYYSLPASSDKEDALLMKKSLQ